ncbi:MAG TPA: hypothetical protein PKV67_07775 [Hyphomonas sp.]|nr:hypothetical protein [Hyphomonas sp.]
MALHIRDFRQSDTAELSRLCETGRFIGALPAQDTASRILAGVRKECLTAAIWISFEDGKGTIPAIIAAQTETWTSDVHELLAEASLWLTSRGAARIDLFAIPEDRDLLAALLQMDFKADNRTGMMRRVIPARSAA